MKKEKLHSNPDIFVIDDFISKDACNHFIELAKPKLARATVSSHKKGIISDLRTNSNCWIDHYHDDITTEIAQKVTDEIGIPVENAEKFQMIHYLESQLYAPHYDAYDKDNSDRSNRCLRYGGQRIWTCLLYLNDVKEGGSTKFTKLDIEVEAKMGRILIFENCHKNHPDQDNLGKMKNLDSLHTGTSVIKGEKWAFNLWFREQPISEIWEYPS